MGRRSSASNDNVAPLITDDMGTPARYDTRGMLIPGTGPEARDEQARRSESGLDGRAESGFEVDRLSLRISGSSWQTFLVDSFVLMFGGTQLAYAMGQMGWFWGMFWLIFSATSTWLSGHVLGALCIETGASSYPELGRACAGPVGEVGAHLCQWFGYYLTGVVQIAFMSASWDQTFRGQAWAEDICQWEWMYISATLLIPFVQVPNFSSFGKLALLSSFSSIYMVIVYLMTIGVNGAYSAGTAPSDDAALNDALWSDAAMTNASVSDVLRAEDDDVASLSASLAADVAGLDGVSMPCYTSFTYSSMLASISNMAFTFAGHGTFPEQIREMSRPTEFGFAFNVLYALAVPFYMLCACVGFWAFGNMASANQVENLQDGLAVHIALCAGLVTTFPVIVLGQVVLMLGVELPLGILPNDFLTNTSSAHLESRVAAFLRPFPPVVVRFLFRTAYVGSLLFWAQALVGAGLAFYVNIAGSLGLAAMTYWLPYVFALARSWRISTRGASSLRDTDADAADGCADAVNVGCAASRGATAAPTGARAALYAVAASIGLFISGCGLYFNLSGLVAEGHFQLFTEATCREGAHFWGDDMWNAALDPNTTAYQTLVVGCCQNGSTCGS